MRLCTIEQILKAAHEAGAPVTREQFVYYTRFGLLYSPDVKVKRRKKEGIISFYAEETVERLKRIGELKADGYSLGEIRDALLEEDRKQVDKLHEAAGLGPVRVEPGGPGAGPSYGANGAGTGAGVRRWMKEGYYPGLKSIYAEIIGKARVAAEVRTSELARIDALERRILSQVSAFWDKRKIKSAFEGERTQLRGEIDAMKARLSGVIRKRDELEGFWSGQVEDGGLWGGQEG